MAQGAPFWKTLLFSQDKPVANRILFIKYLGRAGNNNKWESGTEKIAAHDCPNMHAALRGQAVAAHLVEEAS